MHLRAGLYLNSGKKSVPFLVKTFFFWSSPELGGKKCSISGEDLFVFFFLVFTEFAYLKKVLVEVHPPNVENSVKLQIIPPNAQQRFAPLVFSVLLMFYHTRRRFHTVPLIAERQAGKL